MAREAVAHTGLQKVGLGVGGIRATRTRLPPSLEGSFCLMLWNSGKERPKVLENFPVGKIAARNSQPTRASAF